MNFNNPLFILFVIASCAASAVSADPRQCAILDDDQARLACFDLLYPKSAIALEQPLRSEKAGFHGASELANKTQEAALAIGTERRIEIVKVDYDPHRNAVFTLANGQVWVQTSAKRKNLKPGDRVSFKEGIMNSVFLVTANGVSVRVKKRSRTR